MTAEVQSAAAKLIIPHPMSLRYLQLLASSFMFATNQLRRRRQRCVPEKMLEWDILAIIFVNALEPVHTIPDCMQMPREIAKESL